MRMTDVACKRQRVHIYIGYFFHPNAQINHGLQAHWIMNSGSRGDVVMVVVVVVVAVSVVATATADGI